MAGYKMCLYVNSTKISKVLVIASIIAIRFSMIATLSYEKCGIMGVPVDSTKMRAFRKSTAECALECTNDPECNGFIESGDGTCVTTEQWFVKWTHDINRRKVVYWSEEYNCESGWTWLKEFKSCVRIINADATKDYFEVKKVCKSYHHLSTLVQVETQGKLNEIKKILEKYTGSDLKVFFLGMRKANNGTFLWDRQQTIAETPSEWWAQKEGQDIGEDCAFGNYMKATQGFMLLFDDRCSQKRATLALCEIKFC